MGIPDILTANLTEALKSVVLAKPPDAMLSLVETMGSLGEKNQTLVQGK